MSDHLAAVAAALGAPEEIVMRSAEARARADGTTAEAVLAGWSGGEAPPAAAEPEPVAAEPDPVEAEPAPAEEEPAPAPAEEALAPARATAPAPAPVAMEAVAVFGPDREINWEAASVLAGMPVRLLQRSTEAKAKAEGRSVSEVLADSVGPGAEVQMPSKKAPDSATATAPVAHQPAAAPEAASESDGFETEAEAAAAGAIPRWLVAAFVVIPTIAILYALFLPNGPNCGDAGSLAVDPVTGVAVNCDLTPYGAETVDYYAMGQAEYTACVACHGVNGGGVGDFPAFVGGALLETFPAGQCRAQVDWVEAGTTGWPDATYGANDQPVGGSGAVMPAFGGTMSDEELRAVVLYERVRFGGQDLETALAECGLVEAGEAGE